MPKLRSPLHRSPLVAPLVFAVLGPSAFARPAFALDAPPTTWPGRIINTADIRTAASSGGSSGAVVVATVVPINAGSAPAPPVATSSPPVPASSPPPVPVATLSTLSTLSTLATTAVTDDVWAKLRKCETGGRYDLNTGNGYYGAYQFAAKTWAKLGYAGLPHQAAPEVQDEAARKLLSKLGWGQWPSCSRKLGLR